MSTLLHQMTELIGQDRLAHAYVLVGDPEREARAFSEELITQLLVTGDANALMPADPVQVRHRVVDRLHPDVHWFEPRSAAREIRVEDMNQAMKSLQQSSFEGGWKVVIFQFAERINVTSANKFLKVLEEPPPRSLILMVTAFPQQLLATIRSRCQIVHVPGQRGGRREAWEEQMLDILQLGPPMHVVDRLARVTAFVQCFDEVGDEALAAFKAKLKETDEELEEDVMKSRESALRRGVRRRMLAAVDRWYRDLLVMKTSGESNYLFYPDREGPLRQHAAKLSVEQCYRLVDNVHKLTKRVDSNLPLNVLFETAVV